MDEGSVNNNDYIYDVDRFQQYRITYEFNFLNIYLAIGLGIYSIVLLAHGIPDKLGKAAASLNMCDFSLYINV